MRKLMKSKVLFGLLGTFLLLTAFGINFAVGGDAQKVTQLSLQGATDLGIKNNYDFQTTKLNVDKAKIEWDSAIKNAKDKSADSITSYDMNLVKNYAPKAAETAYYLAQKNQDLAEKQLKLSVERYYYSVLKAEKNLQIKQENLKYLLNQLKITQTSYSIGTRAKLDVNTMEANVAAAQADVASCTNAYKTAVMDLTKTIGLGIDTPLQLTTRFNIEKVGSSIKIDEVIKKALADDVAIISVQKNLELSKLKNEIAKKYYSVNVKTAKLAVIDEKISLINSQKQEINTTALIKQNYMTLLSLEKVLDWNNKEVAKAQENAQIYTAKYEAGLATSSEVQDAAIKLEQSKKNLADSIFNYNSLKSQFKLEVFTASAPQS